MKTLYLHIALACLAACFVGSCRRSRGDTDLPLYGYRIKKIYPHDRSSFTQGLVIDNGVLYEGTGTYGHSMVCRVDLKSGKCLQRVTLAPSQWGEGITILADTLYQVTWKSHVGYAYDKHTFDLLRKFTYTTEGWGLTQDGLHLIMSDGSATLTFRDPNTFAPQRTVEVHDNRGPVARLNELEYIKGSVYANIWMTDQIAVIDPNTGRVTAKIDLTGLKARNPRGDVLNGIAYDDQTDTLYVTGKYWSELYAIELTPKVSAK